MNWFTNKLSMSLTTIALSNGNPETNANKMASPQGKAQTAGEFPVVHARSDLPYFLVRQLAGVCGFRVPPAMQRQQVPLQEVREAWSWQLLATHLENPWAGWLVGWL